MLLFSLSIVTPRELIKFLLLQSFLDFFLSTCGVSKGACKTLVSGLRRVYTCVHGDLLDFKTTNSLKSIYIKP